MIITIINNKLLLAVEFRVISGRSLPTVLFQSDKDFVCVCASMSVVSLLCLCLCIASPLVRADDQGSFLHDPKNVHNAE